MILECPACEARFRVPPEALGPAGRRVRCGACGHVWVASPDDGGEPETPPDDASASAPEAPAAGSETLGEISAADADADASTSSQETLAREVTATIERLRERPADAAAGVPAVPRRRPTWLMLGWLGWGLFVTSLVAGVLLYRAELQTAWPPSRPFYAMLGFEPESAAPPLPSAEEALQVRFGGTPEWREIGDAWRMTVEGEITNLSDRQLPLPELTLELLNAEGETLKRVPVALARESLEGRGRLAFRKAIEPAPPEISGITYRWEKQP